MLDARVSARTHVSNSWVSSCWCCNVLGTLTLGFRRWYLHLVSLQHWQDFVSRVLVRRLKQQFEHVGNKQAHHRSNTTGPDHSRYTISRAQKGQIRWQERGWDCCRRSRRCHRCGLSSWCWADFFAPQEKQGDRGRAPPKRRSQRFHRQTTQQQRWNVNDRLSNGPSDGPQENERRQHRRQPRLFQEDPSCE